jgi:serine/threonine-protein kinase
MSSHPKVLGKYQILNVLGRGKMGIVYLGVDPDIDRKVAIKVLHPHLCAGEEGKLFVQRFRREAQAAARCLHSNIVTVFDLGKHDDIDFIVMEYVQGEELFDAVESGHIFSEEEVLIIGIAVLKGLSPAHAEGIVHRDIKPANILLMDDGGVKVADFGVSKLGRSDLTMQGAVVGTPSYMSPEGLKGQEVTSLADIYSVGAVLLELLTGARLTADQLYSLKLGGFFEQSLEGESVSKASTNLKTIIKQAMSENPSDRPKSAEVFYKALEKLLPNKAAAKPQNKSLELDDYTQGKLKDLLANIIGPIAPVLLKKGLERAKDNKELLSILSESIEEGSERDTFLEQSKKFVTFEKSQSNTLITSNQNQRLAIDKDSRESLKDILVSSVGPIAPMLLKKALGQALDTEELLQILASSIEEGPEREAFREQARKVIG